MGAGPRILVVDDVPNNVKLLSDLLRQQGYEVSAAGSGREALEKVRAEGADLVLLDVMMPDLNGHEVCRAIRADPALQALPVLLVTALDAPQERVQGLEAGADDFISKPFSRPELLARVKSQLRAKQLHDALAQANATLAQRVREQVAELERLNALKRFVSPRVRAMIQTGEIENPFATRRREISVIFADLRGFTAFTEAAEPEEVMGVLRQYHSVLGDIVMRHDGTVEHFAADGLMVLFNDPLPVPRHELAAVRVALRMREAMQTLIRTWARQGFDLGFGAGVASGYATLGTIGFEGRREYAAIGTVCNLASRLCAEAASGQVLVTQRVASRLEEQLELQPLGELTLKGLLRPVAVSNVLALRAAAPG